MSMVSFVTSSLAAPLLIQAKDREKVSDYHQAKWLGQ
jgi:hypothetical protein